MNMTELLKIAKRRLGIMYFKLPIPDSDFIDIIKEETLPTFSAFYPFYIDMPWNPNEYKVTGEDSVYMIPVDKLDKEMPLITVEEITRSNFIGGIPDYYAMDAYDFNMAWAGANLDELTNIPICFDKVGKNKIRIDDDLGGFAGTLTLHLCVRHHPSLSTIDEDFREEFIKLCVIDFKIFLYENLKHFDGVDTTFGQISLKLDDWSSSRDDRENLLKEWEETYLFSRRRRMYNA